MFILRKIYYFLIDTIQSLLMAAAVFLVIYVFLFRPFQVNGQSMYPNFEDKQHVLTDLISYRFNEPKRGDVIVFKAPPDSEKDYIKRIIALSGDIVTIKNGLVYVNNALVNELSYLDTRVKTYGGAFLRDGDEIIVPEGSFFVIGDNRTASSDSREWGFVKKSDIIGRSFFVYWPFNDVKLIKNPYKN